MKVVLSKKKCTACEGWEKSLTKAQYAPFLKQTPKWKVVKGKSIEREFIFKNFVQAISFINKVGKIAESEGHHPDILLYSYKKVKIMLSTHAIKGLSENDFIVAAKTDKIKL